MKVVAAGGLVFNEYSELLMIYRRGKWDLPKGHLDAGESIEQCALREVAEETGLSDITLHGKIGTTSHTYIESATLIEKKTHWYKMSVTDNRQLQPQIEEDITTIQWVSLTNLDLYLKNTYSNIVQIIQKSDWK